VHGDFGLRNAIMSADGDEVVAILDREEARLGDPTTNLVRRLFGRAPQSRTGAKR
jgi:aminoglycoside phosphotransferase (APT) family kinase protein